MTTLRLFPLDPLVGGGIPPVTPAEPMPAPIKEPNPFNNPDAPVREPDPEEPQQI
jgi:hypothetical protein